LNDGRDTSVHKAYTACALANCSNLLAELTKAMIDGQEMTVRTMSRVQTEAFLIGAYVTFGGMEALRELHRASKSEDVTLRNELDRFNKFIKLLSKKARARRRKVRKANANLFVAIERGDKALAAKLLAEPPEPRLNLTDSAIAHLEAINPDLDEWASGEGIKLKEVVEWLTKEGPKRGFATQSFEPIYHIYRVASQIGVHTSLTVIEHYMRLSTEGGYFSTRQTPATKRGVHDQFLWDATFSTAQLSEWAFVVLGWETPVASEVRALLEPGVDVMSGWRAN
jgi:hypothetical protein